MKARFIILLIAVCISIGLVAQDGDGTKILVFRNSGEINVFNTDSITKAELSVFDADSVEHAEYVSQVFYRKTRQPVVIPLADIDSVAFGVRNIIEPKKGVRKLSDVEAEGISSFDGEILTYDSRLTLTAGETVYYERITDALPFGLLVRVLSTNGDGNSRRADVKICDPEDVFDRYLITGEEAQRRMSKIVKSDDYDQELLKLVIPETEINGYTIEGLIELKVKVDAENVVLNFLKHYYHADIKLLASPRIEFKVLAESKKEANFESSKALNIPFRFFGGALNANLELKGFMDLEAEVGVSYEFNQDYFVSVEWTRKDGKNTFDDFQTNKSVLGDLEQKIEAHLNGEIFLGPLLDLSINTVFEVAGAGIKIKLGPKLEAEFGLGVLNKLTDRYEDEIYAKAHIDVSLGAKAETYFSHRPWKNFSVIEKTKLPFEFEAFTEPWSLNIFPEFKTKAVLDTSTPDIVQSSAQTDAVSVSTFTETELPYPLDVDFEIADIDSDAMLAEVEIEEVLESGAEEYQNLSGEIEIPKELGVVDKDKIVARPIINYKGCRVKCKPVTVAGDMAFTPLIASLAGNGSYFVSGMTPVSQTKYDGTTYIEGNLIGLLTGDRRHRKKTFSTVEFVDLSALSEGGGSGHPLLGEWAGQIGSESVSMNFIDNETGEFNGTPFNYRYNAPLLGGIAIQLANGGTISFSILELSDDTMTIVMKGGKSTVSLSKK